MNYRDKFDKIQVLRVRILMSQNKIRYNKEIIVLKDNFKKENIYYKFNIFIPFTQMIIYIGKLVTNFINHCIKIEKTKTNFTKIIKTLYKIRKYKNNN